MTNGNVGSIAGTTFGILGMGIGVGILARTARGVTDTMYGPQQGYSRRRSYSRSYKPKSY